MLCPALVLPAALQEVLRSAVPTCAPEPRRAALGAPLRRRRPEHRGGRRRRHGPGVLHEFQEAPGADEVPGISWALVINGSDDATEISGRFYSS